MENNNLLKHLLKTDLSFIKIKNKQFKVIKERDAKQREELLKPPCWLNEITEIENRLSKMTKPSIIVLNNSSVITNVSKFIKSHLSVVRSNNGNVLFYPYLDRLLSIETLMLETTKESV